MHINELLTTVVDLGGSDLHLKVGNYPIARVKGHLTPLTQFKKLVQEDTIAMAYSIMAMAEPGLSWSACWNSFSPVSFLAP